jgi:hypothetical protein
MRMRRPSWTPSIVPNDNDETVYLVADDFGRLGRAWREADYEATDFQTVIQDLLTGQYGNPIRVVAFRLPRTYSIGCPIGSLECPSGRCSSQRESTAHAGTF